MVAAVVSEPVAVGVAVNVLLLAVAEEGGWSSRRKHHGTIFLFSRKAISGV